MLHRAPPRAAGLRRARHDVGPTPRITAPVIGAVAGFVVTVRVKASLEAFAAGSPARPLPPTAAAPGQLAGARILEDQSRAAAGPPAPTA